MATRLFFLLLFFSCAFSQNCAPLQFDALGCVDTTGCCYLSENLQTRPIPGESPTDDWTTHQTCMSVQDYKTERVLSRGLSVAGFLSLIKSTETDIDLLTFCSVEKSYIDTNSASLIDPLFCECNGQPLGLGNYSALGVPYQSECEKFDPSTPGDRCFMDNADCFYISGTNDQGEGQNACESIQNLNFNVLGMDPEKSLEENFATIGVAGVSKLDDSNICSVYSLLPADLVKGWEPSTCWTADPSTSKNPFECYY